MKILLGSNPKDKKTSKYQKKKLKRIKGNLKL